MKGNCSYLFVSALLFMAACQPTEAPLTDAEKSEIETEVLAVFNTMVDGMNEHDADKIAGCYQKSERLRYAGDGTLRSGWQALQESTSSFHSDPSNQAWSVAIDEAIVDVLSREMAIVTARGTATGVDQEGNAVQEGYSVTDVFQYLDGGWVIINEHESVSEPTGTGVPEQGT